MSQIQNIKPANTKNAVLKALNKLAKVNRKKSLIIEMIKDYDTNKLNSKKH